MQNIISFLDGKKAFIGAAILFAAGGLQAIKFIDDRTFTAIAAIGGAIATFGLRAAITKVLSK
jgi:hypothetical protein